MTVLWPVWAFAVAIWTLGCWHGELGKAFKRLRTKVDPPEICDVVGVVISMLHEKDEWENDGYYMRHPTGVAMWVANEEHGLSLSIGDRVPGPRNVSGGDVEMDDYSRAQLWRAVEAKQNSVKAARHRANTEAFCRRVLARYATDNVVSLRDIAQRGLGETK